MPTIRYPTRISDVSATLIDNIFVNRIEFNYRSAIIYSDISDHLPVAINMDVRVGKAQNKTVIKKRYYTEENNRKFIEALNKCNWEDIIQLAHIDDTQGAYTSFLSTCRQIFDDIYPEKAITYSKN